MLRDFDSGEHIGHKYTWGNRSGSTKWVETRRLYEGEKSMGKEAEE